MLRLKVILIALVCVIQLNGQNSCFSWDFMYENQMFNSNILIDEELIGFQKLNPLSLYGMGIKRSMGSIDNLINAGASMQYGVGNYQGIVTQRFSMFQIGFNLEYEKALGIKSVAHPYFTYPVLCLGASYYWRSASLHALYHQSDRRDWPVLYDDNPRVFAGAGMRIYSKYKYVLKYL